MTDKKLTDAEIVKALECYRNSKIIQVENGVISIGDIFDLINRLQKIVEKCEKVERFADKAIAALQAENEKLKKRVAKLKEVSEK